MAGAEYHIKLKDWSVEDRPREKLITKGKEALSDAELIAILLRTGTKEATAVDLAKNLLLQNGNNLDELGKLSINQLAKIKGIGKVKATQIAAALEIGRRRKYIERPKEFKITSSRDIYEYVYQLYADQDVEHFYVILLNRNNIVLKHKLISKGGVSSTVVDSKLIFKSVMEETPSSIILSHNHPSGNATPSSHDIALTKKLKEAGQLFDIEVLDHLIFAREKYYSFADEGMM